jgi:2'-5' RNA ligase
VADGAAQEKATGGMIALLPADPGPLVIDHDHAEPAEDLHCTLLFLGPDVTDWSETRRGDLIDVVAAAVTDQDGPIHAAVGGHATFKPGSDEPVAVHLISGDGLADLHQRVTSAAAAVLGDELHEQFTPWLPHITGAYNATAADLSYTGDVVFDRVLVVFAGERHEIPLLDTEARLVEAVRAAYAVGWARTGGPMTERVQAGCRAAISYALEHPGDPDLLEATIQLGSVEGTWAHVLHRREALYKDRINAALDAWRQLIDRDQVAAAVKAFRKALGLRESSKEDRDRRRAEATAAALALLHGWVNPADADWQAFVLANADALNDARAEGWAGAVAIAADQAGHPGINLDLAFTEALHRLGNPGNDHYDGETIAGDIVNGAVGDLADLLAGVGDDESDDDLTDAAIATLSRGRAVQMLLDMAMGTAFAAGAVALYAAEGVQFLDFVTVGDDRVCQRCLDIEARNPWRRSEAPEPEIHPLCRCVLTATDPITALRSVDLDSFA